MSEINPQTQYPCANGIKEIKDMSKGYLTNQIEYIKRTDKNLIYLPALEEQLKIKLRKTFKLLK